MREIKEIIEENKELRENIKFLRNIAYANDNYTKKLQDRIEQLIMENRALKNCQNCGRNSLVNKMLGNCRGCNSQSEWIPVWEAVE